MPPPDLLPDPALCGRLVAWVASAVAGRTDVDTAASAVERGADGHVVAGLDAAAGTGPTAEVPLRELFERLRAARVRTVALVLPAPGDPLGVAARGAFGAAALAAELGVVVDTGADTLGLIPQVDLRGSSYRGWRWQVFRERGPEPGRRAAFGPSVPDVVRVIEQADRALRRAMREATDVLAGLDLARWRPEVVAGRGAADSALDTRVTRLPATWPAAAAALGDRAMALWQVLRVARSEPGAASASAGRARAEALAGLSHAVREAAMTAYNVPARGLLGDDTPVP